ncbi:MAG: Phosphate acetyltransferase [Candidatus Thorarchaeota archaeon]|nr:MAG: Phosphate acetyltransferase [Candidatus Thorarchaeota archaeon]
MVKNIVITGDTITGKTLIALGIAAKLRTAGKEVGYFKPVGTKSFDHSTIDHDADEDAVVMKSVLELKSEVSCICPIIRTKSSYDEFLRAGHDKLLDQIMTCYTKLSSGKDIMLIEGTKAPWHLLHVGLSTAQIATKLEASVICLVNFPDITAIDDILLQREFFKSYGVEEITVVLNLVPPMLKGTIHNHIREFIEENGMHYGGAIYQNRELFSPSVREILRALDGQIITGEDHIDSVIVDQFMVGSMAPENALKWFRRAKHKAVITSGDRSDICLAAMETDTNLLILTGGMGPDIRTVSRAKELGIPIIMTAHDTYTTGQIVDNLVATVTPENKEKIALVERIIGEALNLSHLGI